MAVALFSATTMFSLASNMLVGAVPVISAKQHTNSSLTPSVWAYPDAIPDNCDHTGPGNPDLDFNEDDDETLTEHITRIVNDTRARASVHTSCLVSGHSLNPKFEIRISGIPKDEHPGWCGGFWDNLHGRLCTPSFASCETIDANGHDDLVWSFRSSHLCTSPQVERAFYKATRKRFGNLKCIVRGEFDGPMSGDISSQGGSEVIRETDQVPWQTTEAIHVEDTMDSAMGKTRRGNKEDAITAPTDEEEDAAASIPHIVELVPRGNAPIVYNDTLYCHSYRQVLTMEARIGIPPTPEITEENAGGWCKGLWDNLHGRACFASPLLFTHWCGWEKNAGGLTWEFGTTHFCRFEQIEEAFKLATYGKFGTLHCEEWKSWVENSWQDHTRHIPQGQGNSTKGGDITIDSTTSVVPLLTSEPTTLITATPMPKTTAVSVADKMAAQFTNAGREIASEPKETPSSNTAGPTRGSINMTIIARPNLSKSITNTTNSATAANRYLPLIQEPHNPKPSPGHITRCFENPQKNALGLSKGFRIEVPTIPEAEIAGWCGGLWDNLHHRICSVHTTHYCGKNPAIEGGLLWEFMTTQFCDTKQVEEAFWYGTNQGRFGGLECVDNDNIKREIGGHSTDFHDRNHPVVINETAITTSNTFNSTETNPSSDTPESIRFTEHFKSTDPQQPGSTNGTPILDKSDTSLSLSNSSVLDKREWIGVIPTAPKPGVIARCYIDYDFLRTFRIEVPSVPDDEIEDTCRGLWDNLHHRVCTVSTTFICAKSGAEEGGLLWKFATTALCVQRQVEIAWYLATQNGTYGGLECKDMKLYNLDHS